MKLWHINDVDRFFEVIDKCEGQVYLVGEDIRLNLKSKLAQYFSLAKIFSDGEIPELELEVTNPADGERLINFSISG